MDNLASPGAIQKSIWDGRIPLEIALAPSESRVFDKSDAYLVMTAHADITRL
jgi:autophagy-related protein 5